MSFIKSNIDIIAESSASSEATKQYTSRPAVLTSDDRFHDALVKLEEALMAQKETRGGDNSTRPANDTEAHTRGECTRHSENWVRQEPPIFAIFRIFEFAGSFGKSILIFLVFLANKGHVG